MSARHSSRECHRQLALARTLHARLWLSSEGRVFVARGRTDFEKLRHSLARYSAPPTVVEAPTPHQLGISGCDGELTDYTLLAIGQALARWSRSLNDERNRTPARRRHCRQLDIERQEIERLQMRLAAAQHWRKQLLAGTVPPGMPYFLDGRGEDELRQALKDESRSGPYPPLVAWLARVVCWLAGSRATRRFLQGANVLADRWDDFAPAEQLRRLERRLEVFRKRSRNEQPYAVLAELRAALAALPRELAAAAGLSACRKNSVAEYCELLLASCRRWRGKEHAASWHRLPGTIAAWAASDGGTAPLPPRVVGLGVAPPQSRRLEQFLRPLSRQFGEPGYDLLLVAIEQLLELVCPGDISPLRVLLSKGASIDDLAWAAQRGQIWRLADTGVKPRIVRRIAERMAHVGVGLHDEDLSALVPVLRTSRQTAIVERWIGWVGQFSGRIVTPRLKRVLHNAATELLVPALSQETLHETLFRWLKPAGCRSPGGLPPQAETHDWLRRIAAYQVLAGDAPTIPKSVRKVLQCKGTALGAVADSPRALRAAQEALLMIAVSALRIMLHRRIEASWRGTVGFSLSEVSLSRAIRLAAWLEKMDATQRELLRQIGVGWELYGKGYKQHLLQNGSWLPKFRASGRDLSLWFGGAPEIATLAGQQLTVGIEHDPLEIFLMGDYFGTCLSVGQFNDMSVVANAHDANKQVVYLAGHSPAGKRQVVARQLIAVSTDFRLLGYRCYVSLNKRQASERLACISIIAAFCGRLARRCGIQLANEGTPETIGSHFWYDDGTHAWLPAALEAWQAEDQRLRHSRREVGGKLSVHASEEFAVSPVSPNDRRKKKVAAWA